MIMQLGRPGVGYGVMESRVESGRIDRHPIKRARDDVHLPRRGHPRESGSAEGLPQGGDPGALPGDLHQGQSGEIQRAGSRTPAVGGGLPVQGRVDVRRIFIGEMDDETADQHYRDSMALGTMLQMRPEMWPADRPAFDKYWEEQLENIHIDDAVRKFLYPIAVARLRGLPRCPPRCRTSTSVALMITTGFLPQRFRDEMKLDWNPTKQREFDALMTAVRLANNIAPSFVRNFPFNVLLHDVNWRMRTGRPLV